MSQSACGHEELQDHLLSTGFIIRQKHGQKPWLRLVMFYICLAYLRCVVIPCGKLTVCYRTWIFIVDVPIKKVFFHSYANVYERVGIIQRKKSASSCVVLLIPSIVPHGCNACRSCALTQLKLGMAVILCLNYSSIIQL